MRTQDRRARPVVVVMGVAGSGKTTVGRALAERIGAAFVDADDLHPAANVARMRAGIPLEDADRRPWLERVAATIAGTPGDLVVACSALRRDYRDLLRRDGGRPIVFAHLNGGRALLADRLAERSGHFMPPELLDSQLATLEPLDADEQGFVLDVAEDVPALVAAAAAALRSF